MENWPVDSRIRDVFQPVTNRQGPRKVLPELSWDTPASDTGTWATSRIIAEGSGTSSKLSWVNINSTGTHISAGNTRCIFPLTRYEIIMEDGLSFERKVLHMNAWLRKHGGVEDIEATFLRELMEDDDDYRKKSLEYDPYCSDLLAIGFISKGHRKRAGVLVYPMGQDFDSLGSSVAFDEKWGTVISPVESPIWKAPGPILQIVSSDVIYKPSAINYTDAGCLFAVRTPLDISFLAVAPKPGASTPTKLNKLATITQADIGGHRPFDVAFNPHVRSNQALVVSDVGAVWDYELGSAPHHLHTSTDDITTNVGAYHLPYWGVEWGAHPETFMLGSQSSLNLYDRRIPGVASVLPIKSEILTSFDVLRNRDFSQAFVSGTEHISLVDERMFGRPVVSWAHYRTYDRTLRIKALELENKQVGLLSSKRSSFVSVYDPLLSDDGGLIGCDSYGLEWGSTNRCISTSITTYIPPSRAFAEKQAVPGSIFHLSHAGAVYRQDLTLGPCKPSGEDAMWAHELECLAERVELGREKYTELEMTESKDALVREKYTVIFMSPGAPTGPSAVEVVELVPTIFQRANEPIDQVITLHDMVRMASQQETSITPRSLFASTNSIPLPKTERLSRYIVQLRNQAREAVPWSCDLSVIQAHIWPHLTPNPSTSDLAAFSLRNTEDTHAAKWDEEARQEIALDLALATTTYSNVPFRPSRPRLPPAPIAYDDDDMLSIAATALTLEGIEPPHVQHVQPCPTKGLVDGKRGAEQRQSLVARLLASEWDPDSSPNDYEFFDAYGEDYDESMPAWKLMARTKADKQSLQQAKSRLGAIPVLPSARTMQLPSMQVSRAKPPPIPKPVAVRPSRHVESQPELTVAQTMSSQPREWSSQVDPASQKPSTQVVPGPFGGRPGTNPPKKKKSRLPGF